MQPKMPKTPFAMSLSGSAKETELRIRNIFQWKKKRPPVIVLIAAVLVIVFCGSLVSFTTRTPNYDLIPDDVTVMDVVDLSGSLVYADERNGSEFDLYWLKEGQEPDLLCRFGHWGSPNVRLEKVSLGEHVYLFVRHDGHYLDVPFWNYKKFTDIFYVPQDGAPLYTLQIEGNFRLEDVTDDGVKELVHEDEAKCYAAALNGYLLEVDEHGRLLSGAVEEEILERLYNGNFSTGVGHAAALVRKYEGIDLHISEDTLSVLTKADASGQDQEKAPELAPEFEVPLHTAELTGLTLDEHGRGDDSLTVLTYVPSEEEPGRHPEVIVRLGTGEELTCTLFCNSKSRPVLEAAYLTSETRQSVLICLESTISNYGYARYHVLEVVDGELVVTDLTGERETLYEFSVCPRSVSKIASVSISVLGNSKGNPDWITLTWADGKWKEETGLYYSETHTLTVADGRELTLFAEGVLLEDRKNYYRLSKLELYDGYDRLQTIDANSIEFDGDYLFQGLYVAKGSGPYGEPIVWDINFDGSQDISFLCCYAFPINIPYAHFLWNEETQQLTFNTVLCAYLELDEENHRLVEQMVGAAGANDWYNTYEFNADGQLVLIESKIIYRT